MTKVRAIVVATLLAVPAAQAADIEAGKAKVAAVCGACHGVAGVSVSETIPNLAAQRAGYIEAQLKVLKDGTRKNPVMNAIAAQLTKTGVTFPEGYDKSFVKYHTINFPATKQVRYYYANKTAVAAAKAGKDLPNGSYLFAEVWSAKLDDAKNPIKGADGFFVADKQVAYTAMSRDAGWGKDIPEMLRNEDWNYAVFTLDKKHRPGVNQAECLACHKPLDKVSYTFTLKELAAAK